MNLEQARTVAEMFRGIGGFSEVEVSTWGGFDGFSDAECLAMGSPRNYHVHLWIVGPCHGTRELTVVRELIADSKEAKQIAAAAKKKAKGANQRSTVRASAQAEVDRE